MSDRGNLQGDDSGAIVTSDPNKPIPPVGHFSNDEIARLGKLEYSLILEQWAHALEGAPNKSEDNGARFAKGWFTAVLSRVTVQLPNGEYVSRVIIFTSKRGVPQIGNLKYIDHSDAVIIQATPDQAHAEIAARDFRVDQNEQRKLLQGGIITSVNSAVVTNQICSPVCAGAFNTFVGDPAKRILPGSQGFVEGNLLNPPDWAEAALAGPRDLLPLSYAARMTGIDVAESDDE